MNPYNYRNWPIWVRNTYIYYRYKWDETPYALDMDVMFIMGLILTLLINLWSLYSDEKRTIIMENTILPRYFLRKRCTLIIDTGNVEWSNLYSSSLNHDLFTSGRDKYRVDVDYQCITLLEKVLEHCKKLVENIPTKPLVFHWSVDDFLCKGAPLLKQESEESEESEELNDVSNYRERMMKKVQEIVDYNRELTSVHHEKGMLLGLEPAFHYRLKYIGTYGSVKNLRLLMYQLHWVQNILRIWSEDKRDRIVFDRLIDKLKVNLDELEMIWCMYKDRQIESNERRWERRWERIRRNLPVDIPDEVVPVPNEVAPDEIAPNEVDNRNMDDNSINDRKTFFSNTGVYGYSHIPEEWSVNHSPMNQNNDHQSDEYLDDNYNNLDYNPDL